MIRSSWKATITFRPIRWTWSTSSRAPRPRSAHGKGTASYYNVVVDGEVNADAAWYYPDTKEAANNIEHRVTFWKGVEVVD